MDVDETIWLMRSANFYYALGQKDTVHTNQRNTPGVISMWAGTIGFLIEFPEYRGHGQGYFSKFSLFDDFLREHHIDPLDIVEKARMVLIAILAVVLGFGYWFVRKMVGVVPALIGFLLIFLDPWFLALSRINHLDAPQAVFQFVSIMALCKYLFFGRRRSFLFISGLMGGLAFLARLPALLTIPAIFLIAGFDFILNVVRNGVYNRKSIFPWVMTTTRILIVWLFFFILAILLFWPFAVTHPIQVFQLMIYHPERFIADEPVFSASHQISNDLLSFTWMFRYINNFLWNTTPVIIAGMIMALIAFLYKLGDLRSPKVRNLIYSIVVFSAVYTIAMTLPTKWSPRYYLPVHLFADFISGLGWVVGLKIIAEKWLKTRAQIATSLILFVVFSFHIIDIAPSYPYYFPYFNPLMGGSERAVQSQFIGRGEGLDLAAAYLNSKPDSSDLNVMAWYGYGPFSFFFNGTTKHLPVAATWDYIDTQRLFDEIDYLVTYSNQWARHEPEGLFLLIEGIAPEHSIWINEIEYARIYKVSDIIEGNE